MHVNRRSVDASANAAMLACAALMAQFIAGKSARDALFFSNYPVTFLPVMIAVSAAAAVAAALAASRAIARLGPVRFVRRVLVASAVAHLLEGALAVVRPPWASLVVFLHIAVAAPILISGFWAIVGERFDPRSGKRVVGRIGAFGAAGGLVGGVLAERTGAWLSIPALFPALAALHLTAAWALRGVGEARGFAAPTRGPGEAPPSLGEGLRAAARTPYLRSLAALVVLAAAGAALLDYAFMAHVRAITPRGEDLVRIFSVFYTASALAAFLLQAGVARPALERLGLARTAGTLPAVLVVGAIPFLAEPALATILLARGSEIAVRGSLFRAGYELLYMPVPPAEKRPAKLLIDICGSRLGDALGAGLIGLLLLFGAGQALPRMVALAGLFGVAALLLTGLIQRGYVRSLERNLLRGAIALDLNDLTDVTTRTAILRITRPIARAEFAPTAPGASEGPARTPETFAGPQSPATSSDPLLTHIGILRSGSAHAVQELLATRRPLPRSLAPHVIPLLARPDITADAALALSGVAGSIAGLLTDALLDADLDLSLRQRVARILGADPTDRAVEGLLRGLEDARFEIRFQCGRALARARERRPDLAFDRDRVFRTALHEVEVDRSVWEGNRQLARLVDPGDSPLVDDYLRDRAHRSLEHVFTVLSLVLPSSPLRIAFRALHTEEETLRGTALEYLESVLPLEIRHRLWPFLEEHGRPRPVARSREEILDQLVQSNQSIELNLAELKLRQEP
jgi:hypothetical protein